MNTQILRELVLRHMNELFCIEQTVINSKIKSGYNDTTPAIIQHLQKAQLELRAAEYELSRIG